MNDNLDTNVPDQVLDHDQIAKLMAELHAEANPDDADVFVAEDEADHPTIQ